MGDNTSAGIFGELFHILATDAAIPEDVRLRLAQRVWLLKKNGRYDFSADDMNADADLERLHLSRRVRDPSFPYDETAMMREYGLSTRSLCRCAITVVRDRTHWPCELYAGHEGPHVATPVATEHEFRQVYWPNDNVGVAIRTEE